MIGIERFAGLEHTKAQVQQLAHRSRDDLLGLESPLVLQAPAQERDPQPKNVEKVVERMRRPRRQLS